MPQMINGRSSYNLTQKFALADLIVQASRLAELNFLFSIKSLLPSADIGQRTNDFASFLNRTQFNTDHK